MSSEVEAPGIERHWKAPTLSSHRVAVVTVCGFTFEFHSLEQLAACLEYYRRKHHPSGRLPRSIRAPDHWESQRWFERLPLYLREESKRLKVVAALTRALAEFASEPSNNTPHRTRARASRSINRRVARAGERGR